MAAFAGPPVMMRPGRASFAGRSSPTVFSGGFSSNRKQVELDLTTKILYAMDAGYAAGFATSQRRVPVLTGYLQASGVYAVYLRQTLVSGVPQDGHGHPTPKPTRGGVEITGIMAYLADYAASVHQGGAGRGARPYLLQAWSDANAIFATEVAKP